MNRKPPSSGAARHLLPRGEKEEKAELFCQLGEKEEKAELLVQHGEQEEELSTGAAILPSPPAGEGARRAGEGGVKSRSERKGTFSRHLRRNATEAEKLLWRLLRDRRFANHKFRRQVPIGSYIVDFVCYEAKLIVELDGSQHADCEQDVCRDGWLEAQGFSVLRIWNNDLINRQKQSLDAIWYAVSSQEDGK